MKNAMCVALIILATLPISAQKVGPNCSPNGEQVTALTQDFAARVDGLLREVHAELAGNFRRHGSRSLDARTGAGIEVGGNAGHDLTPGYAFGRLRCAARTKRQG